MKSSHRWMTLYLTIRFVFLDIHLHVSWWVAAIERRPTSWQSFLSLAYRPISRHNYPHQRHLCLNKNPIEFTSLGLTTFTILMLAEYRRHQCCRVDITPNGVFSPCEENIGTSNLKHWNIDNKGFTCFALTTAKHRIGCCYDFSTLWRTVVKI